MSRPSISDIDTIEGAKLWMIEHDARIDSYWESQFKANAEVLKRICALGERTSAIEKRLVWIAGFASALGGMGGSLLTWALTQ